MTKSSVGYGSVHEEKVSPGWQDGAFFRVVRCAFSQNDLAVRSDGLDKDGLKHMMSGLMLS